jgi:hypothetical protein
VTSQVSQEYAVECLWPGVDEAGLASLERRIRRCLGQEPSVRYLGSLLMREDEVVLCHFSGPRAGVRAVAEAAQIPYERIVGLTRSPWS